MEPTELQGWELWWKTIIDGLPVLVVSGAFSGLLVAIVNARFNERLERLKDRNTREIKHLEASLVRAQKYQDGILAQHASHAAELNKHYYATHQELIEILAPLLQQERFSDGRPYFSLMMEPEAFLNACQALEDFRKKYHWLSEQSALNLMNLANHMLKWGKIIQQYPVDSIQLAVAAQECLPELKPLIEETHKHLHADFKEWIPKQAALLIQRSQEARGEIEQEHLTDSEPDTYPSGGWAKRWFSYVVNKLWGNPD